MSLQSVPSPNNAEVWEKPGSKIDVFGGIAIVTLGCGAIGALMKYESSNLKKAQEIAISSAVKDLKLEMYSLYYSLREEIRVISVKMGGKAPAHKEFGQAIGASQLSGMQ